MSSLQEPNDRRFDAQLRRVPLPTGLVQRLLEIGQCSDEQLDAELREVAVPVDLITRINTQTAALICVEQLTDEQLDETIREVAIPITLFSKLWPVVRRQAVHQKIRNFKWKQVALAASLMIFVGLSYFGAVLLLTLSAYNVGPVKPIHVATTDHPQPKINKPAENSHLMPLHFTEEDHLNSPHPEEWIPEDFYLTDQQGIEIIEPDNGSIDDPQIVESENNPDVNPTSSSQLYTADGQFDSLEPSVTISPLERHGLRTPMVPGYDRLFFMNLAVHPRVSPGSHKSLSSINIPLSSETSGFTHLADQVNTLFQSRKRLTFSQLSKLRSKIRTADILASMQYDFRAVAPGRLGLTVFGGPNPFAKQGVRLLQVGVKAGDLPRRRTEGSHLIVAIDVSASMNWHARLEITKSALHRLVDRLGPQDRLTLLTFSDRAKILAENIQHAKKLHSIINSLHTRRATNLGAGLSAACNIALKNSSTTNLNQKILMITDALAELNSKDHVRLQDMLKLTNTSGTKVSIVDISGSTEPDEQLAKLFQSDDVALHQTHHTQGILSYLLQSLSGKSQVIAHDVRLTVRFNPKAVKSYRLIGHEAIELGGLLYASEAIDLNAGQTATGLLELVLQPGGSNQVGTVELSWLDPVTRRQQVTIHRISRVQFADDSSGSAIALQAASMAAETAEIIRGSYYTSQNRLTLQHVLDRADQVHPSLKRQQSFKQLIQFVKQAQAVGLDRKTRRSQFKRARP